MSCVLLLQPVRVVVRVCPHRLRAPPRLPALNLHWLRVVAAQHPAVQLCVMHVVHGRRGVVAVAGAVSRRAKAARARTGTHASWNVTKPKPRFFCVPWSRGTLTSLMSPKGRKAACSTASVTVSSSPPDGTRTLERGSVVVVSHEPDSRKDVRAQRQEDTTRTHRRRGCSCSV